MTTRSRSGRRAAAAVLTAGVATLALAAAPMSGSSASPDGAPSTLAAEQRAQAKADSSAATAAAKAAEAVSSDAGSYIDASGAPVVNVTKASDAAAVRAAGATAKVVPFSTAQLRSAERVLAEKASIPGTAWAIDPTTNKVDVTADSSLTGKEMARLQSVVTGLGGKVTMTREAGTLSTTARGGDAIWAQGGGRCSLGFNVSTPSGSGFVTAGHCTDVAATWYNDQGQRSLLGTNGRGSFPGNDYGIVDTSSRGPNTVNLYNGSTQTITGAGNASVGQRVTRSGSTTGVFGGTVRALNATVNYAEGSVSGLIRTNVCAEPGDSGGSLFAGSTALGLTSGGSGDCSSGGTTYFQPVTEALSAYNASIS